MNLEIIGECELIQRAILNTLPRPEEGLQPRWVLVKRLFACGSTMAERICWKYGFDPDKEVT